MANDGIQPQEGSAHFMDCICEDKPLIECWQYEHHLEHAGEPGAFPKASHSDTEMPLQKDEPCCQRVHGQHAETCKKFWPGGLVRR